MRPALNYREFDAAKDLNRVAYLMSQAFGSDEEQARKWVGETRGRVVRSVERNGASGATLDACLVLISMGQFFGGRSVPMMGIAGVAVAPEARGSGIATTMMTEALREARASGAAISTLYPATQPIYRRVGYEQAGALYNIRIDTRRLIGIREKSLNIVSINKDARSRLAPAYNALAQERDGFLDRGDYIWDRVFTPRGTVAQGYAFEEDGAIEGSVFTVRQAGGGSERREMPLSEFWASTPRAARKILGFLADHSSVVGDVAFSGAAPNSILLAAPEQVATVKVKDYWMVRILDVARALEARGYAPGMRAQVTLEVVDDILPENNGAYSLLVDGGAGKVERAKSGAKAGARMDVRDLAAMYSGFATPATLAASFGRVSGKADSLATLTAVFAGSAPTMADYF